MEFYIYKHVNNAWTWVAVSVEIEPNLTRAWDTTNDSFSCVLAANTDAEPYKPMTAFKIIDDENHTTIMWIINDNVSMFSLSPLMYKHSLSIVQYRYFLNKHLVRNTVFNQPKIKNQKLYTATNLTYTYWASPVSGYYYTIQRDGSNNMLAWQDQVILNPHTKVKSGNFEYCFYYIRDTIETDDNGDPLPVSLIKMTNDVFADMNSTLRDNIYIRFCDANNSDYEIASIKITDTDKNKKTSIPDSVIGAINTYIASRGNNSVKLYGKYDTALDSGETAIDNLITKSFLKTVDPSLQDEQDTDIFMPIILQVHMELNTYNYTMYDVIDTLLKQYRLLTDNGVAKREKIFNLPESGDLYDLLTNTYPPDTMTFTQATFYDALTEIFRFYDAGFKFDENKTLQIEYYNDAQEERNDVKFSGKTMTFADKNLNNGRVAYYQNAIQTIKLPKIPTRSNNLGVPYKTDYCIIVPKPIYSINKLTMFIDKSSFVMCGSKAARVKMELDLTPYIVNNNIWAVLDTNNTPLGSTNYYKLVQQGTIPFERGSNIINISTYRKDWIGDDEAVLKYVVGLAIRRFCGQPKNLNTVLYDNYDDATKWYQHNFAIEYETMSNGRLETKTLNDQYKGEMLVNQGSGMIDLNKMGLNILGESLKDGQPTLTVSCEITNWENKINEGDYIIYNGAKWVANSVNYKAIKDNVFQVTAEFTKNFNALALRVQTDKQKRLTAISAENSILSEDSYIDYVYVTDNKLKPEDGTTIFGNKVLESMIGQTFGIAKSSYTVQNVDVASIITYGENGQVNHFGNLGWSAAYLAIPLIKYGAGNCVCFELQYNEPNSAGNCLIYSAGSYKSYATLYTDDEGWADLVTINFHQNSNITYANYPVLNNTSPNVATMYKLKYYKKPNEIFGLNYELCFLPMIHEINDFFVGNAFIKNNAFIDSAKPALEFYLYYSNSYAYSVMDTKGYEGGNKVKVAFSTNSASKLVQLYILTTTPITAKHWAICDENGDIYFASNHEKTFTTSPLTTTAISFITRQQKMTEQDIADTPIPTLTVPPQVEFTLTPDMWTNKPAIWSVEIGHVPTDNDPDVTYILEDGRTAKWTYSYQSLLLIGVSLTDISIEPATVSGHTNTVSFDSATGTFTGDIYKAHFNTGDEISATIYYRRVGQKAMNYANYSIQIPELIRYSLYNLSISPASDVPGESNTVHYNSATGTFYGKVFKLQEPTADITYTITYTFNP